jgi:hypothetical protein
MGTRIINSVYLASKLQISKSGFICLSPDSCTGANFEEWLTLINEKLHVIF